MVTNIMYYLLFETYIFLGLVARAMIGGAVTAVLWHFTSMLSAAVYEGFPAAVVLFLLAIVVSLLTKSPEKVIEVLEGV